jgi:hypothetical protein
MGQGTGSYSSPLWDRGQILIIIKVQGTGFYSSSSRYRELVSTHHHQGAGDRFLLITIKVQGTGPYSSSSRYRGQMPTHHQGTGDKFLLIVIKVQFRRNFRREIST